MSKIAAALVLTGLLAAGAAQAQASHGGMIVPTARNACALETQTLCPNIPRIQGAARQCLAMHRDHLSTACRNSLGGSHQNLLLRKGGPNFR
ncbi:MAG: hypothetical protein WA840_17400 [Caulobacteraceae bacterium]